MGDVRERGVKKYSLSYTTIGSAEMGQKIAELYDARLNDIVQQRLKEFLLNTPSIQTPGTSFQSGNLKLQSLVFLLGW